MTHWLHALALLLAIGGLVGCIVPVLPGVWLSLAAIVACYYGGNTVTETILAVSIGLAIVATFLDSVTPLLGARRFHVSKYGTWGCFIMMQDVLTNPDDVKLDDSRKNRNSLAFIKRNGEKFWQVVVSSDDDGKCVIHKTMCYKRKKSQYAGKTSVLTPQVSSVAGRPTISPEAETPAAVHRISALDDVGSFSNFISKVNQENVSNVVDDNGEPMVVYHGGSIAGFLVFPWGLLVGPFLGAFLGEILFACKTSQDALRGGVGALLGFVFGVLSKLVCCGLMTVWVARSALETWR